MSWASLNSSDPNDFWKISVRMPLHARLQGETTRRTWSVVFYKIQMPFFCSKYSFGGWGECKIEASREMVYFNFLKMPGHEPAIPLYSMAKIPERSHHTGEVIHSVAIPGPWLKDIQAESSIRTKCTLFVSTELRHSKEYLNVSLFAEAFCKVWKHSRILLSLFVSP